MSVLERGQAACGAGTHQEGNGMEKAVGLDVTRLGVTLAPLCGGG